jgi:hypothetical protein
MPDRRTASSQLRRAPVFLWLAIACGFVSCVYYSLLASDAGEPFVLSIAMFVAWMLLSFFGLRGRSFARWGLVLGLAAAAFVPSFILLGSSLGLSTWADIRTYVANYLQLAAALLWWVVIAGLVFSEPVGDYFARSRDASSMPWDETPLPPRQDWDITAGSRTEFDDNTLHRALFAKRVRTIIVCTFVLSSVLTVLGAAVAVSKVRRETRAAEEEIANTKADYANFFFLFIASAMTPVIAIADVCSYVLGLYLLFFVFPFLITLPITLPFALRWQDPARFLLLRPFGSPAISGKLRRFLRQELYPMGHCYTLADAAIRVSWQVRIPLLLGQLALFSFRTRKVRNPKNLQRLAREMNRRVMRNLNWVLSRDPFFPITCSDLAWQACVRAVVERADVVLMDVSVLSPNMLWELDLLRDSGALARTVLLVRENDCELATQKLIAHAAPVAGVPLVVYGNDGVAGVLAKPVAGILCP